MPDSLSPVLAPAESSAAATAAAAVRSVRYSGDATPASRRSQFTPYVAVTVAVVIVCAAHARWMGAPIFPVDDAYITVHNAQVLNGAPERNFPGTPALMGATSVLHTTLEAALMRLFPPLWAAMMTQYLALLLFGWTVVRLTRVLDLAAGWAYLLIATSVTGGGMVYQLFGGLETSLALAAVAFTLGLAAQGKPSRGLMIACALLPFLRPELAALSMLLVVWQGSVRIRDRQPGRFALDLVCIAAAAAPLFALIYCNTGSLIPSTIAAKKYFFAEELIPARVKFRWVFGSVSIFAFDLGPLLAGVLFLASEELGLFLLAFVPIFLGAYFLQFPGGLGHYAHRYLYIFLPLALLGICRGLKARMRLTRSVAALLVVLSAGYNVLTLGDSWRMYSDACNFTRVELAGTADFCRRTVPAGSRLLIHDAGYLPYATDFPMVDLVGLKTPQIVRYHQQLTYPTGGRGRSEAIHEIALATHPQYLVVLNGWEMIYHIAGGLRRYGWTVMPLNRLDPITHKVDFAHNPAYLLFSLTPPSDGMKATTVDRGAELPPPSR